MGWWAGMLKRGAWGRLRESTAAGNGATRRNGYKK